MTRHRTRWAALLVVATMPLPFSACGDNPTSARPTSERTSTAPDPGPSGTVQQPWTLLADEPEDVPVEAGSYALTANGSARELAVVRVPEGYTNHGGWTVISGEPFHAIGYLTADLVFRDPCGSSSRSKYATASRPGPTVADLAEALVAQKGARTSTPAPVTIDGHAGLHLEYQVSPRVDVASCEDRAFDIFTTGPGGWYLEASRERADIWILDVGGDRVVLAWCPRPV